MRTAVERTLESYGNCVQDESGGFVRVPVLQIAREELDDVGGVVQDIPFEEFAV
jgi:hypothetical protein